LEEIISGALYVVSTPIGNLGDISYRAIHILNSVDLIAAEDTRVTSRLLNHYNIKTKTIPYHSYNQKSQTPKLINKLNNGESLALVSDAGTPGISDPAYELVKACIQKDIKIIPIPGASAFLAALVVSGLPVNRFVFEGFLPQKKGRQTKLNELKDEKRTLVFYESPHRILKTISEFLKYFGNRQCLMGREITKKFEEFFRGSLKELFSYIESKKIKGEIVIVVEGNTVKK
jgi:16S rRNA (cytidine1402-2'-O)-methyltransferase